MSERSITTAMWRGFRRLCPNCGRGAAFKGYLKVAPVCDHCGEQLGHFRADDGPAWATIFIVAHVIVPVALWIEQGYSPPLLAFVIAMLLATLLMTLAVLPLVKGAFVGLMWALRLRGDERHDQMEEKRRPE
ncbi:DUF983 domain-containing protein [Telmatospirillum sp. J64-1]|uniref:DUF983 domain-containing protein n=1 Tax=Telmatospirillum sp. J64-1 TaxID=2502183 RepID=UPI00115D1CC7|nr:DUF983 domain-containing protein [Telmatospirillum sp. J64-1]